MSKNSKGSEGSKGSTCDKLEQTLYHHIYWRPNRQHYIVSRKGFASKTAKTLEEAVNVALKVFGSSLSELLRAVPRRRPAAAADAVGSEGAEGSQGAAADAVGSDGIEGSQGSAAGSGTPPFFSPLSLIASEGLQWNCKACASGIHARLPCMRCAGFRCPGSAAEPLKWCPPRDRSC